MKDLYKKYVDVHLQSAEALCDYIQTLIYEGVTTGLDFYVNAAKANLASAEKVAKLFGE